MCRSCITLLVLTVLPGLALRAQQEGAEPDVHSALLVVPPAQLRGSIPQLLPTNAGTTQNEFLGGLVVGALFDDNIATSNHQPQSGYLYFVSPSMVLQQTRRRTTWDLNYTGGLTIAQHDPANNNGTQNTTSVAAQMHHLFGPHTLLELRQDFLMTNNPFGQADQGQTVSAVSGTGQLNSSAGVPIATRTSFVSSGALTYQFSRRSSLGINGSFSSLRFRDLPKLSGVDVNLIDGRTTTGRVFYVLDISRGQRIGAEYQVQDLRFGGDAAHTLDQTVFLFDEIHLRSNMTLTLFGGPGYTHLHNNVLVPSSGGTPSVLPSLRDEWSPSGGASYTWQGKRLAVRLTGSSLITDGGGALGTVRAFSGSGELREDLSKRWTGTLGYTYSDGRLIGGPINNGASRITTEQASVGVVHHLSQQISMTAEYAHLRQLGGGAVTPYSTGDHNRASVSMTYQFVRPLGR